MLERLTISSEPPAEPALDHAALFQEGMDLVRRFSRRVWTDHNLHDPGVTTLEILCYALTDIAYRASFPVADILASGPSAPNPGARSPLFPARAILPARPLTSLDYRKLLVDLPGVRNAWIEPVAHTLYVDPVTGQLVQTNPGTPGTRSIAVQGIHRALVDLTDAARKAGEEANVLAAVSARLAENRGLCLDFEAPKVIERHAFALCGELELAPDAVVVDVFAQIKLRVNAYLAPPVPNHGLAEMLARMKPDGTAYTVAEIFEGPALRTGFITDEEIAAAALRTEIRLSDVIHVIMGVPGVRAVRDLLVTPAADGSPLPDKWRVPVAAGKRAVLDDGPPRLVAYKRGIPFRANATEVQARVDALALATAPKGETDRLDDLPAPVGRARNTSVYHSFQNHFPALYGLGEDGAPAGADDRRRALAYQLKAYLLFFDQILADDCAQLSRAGDLFSLDPALKDTYFHQPIKSFTGWESIYARPDLSAGAATEDDVRAVLHDRAGPAGLPADVDVERRNRFLDHLIARFAERFHDYVAVTAASLGTTPLEAAQVKVEFLKRYPTLSMDRGLGYDASLTAPADLWDTGNVSGLEKRVAAMLGIADTGARRQDLGAGDVEGMLLIESILLRSDAFAGKLLSICADPSCTDCGADDPYSYRLHVLFPAEAGRFKNMDFRRFAAEVLREEAPAHVAPRICWVDNATMRKVEDAYHAFLTARAAGVGQAELSALIVELEAARSVYPVGHLHGCDADEPAAAAADRFLIGQSRLGSQAVGGGNDG